MAYPRVVIRLIPVVAVASLIGCASLTSTQISGINAYSELLDKNAKYPCMIVTEFINIKYDIEQLNSGTIGPGLVNEKLWNSYRGKEEALNQSHRVNIGLAVIEQYAEALCRLSSKDLSEKLKEPSERLGKNIDTLVSEFNLAAGKKAPIGIGKLLSKALVFTGQGVISIRQATVLKQCIREADTLVSVITFNLCAELDSIVIKQWLPALKKDLKIKQEDLLGNLNPRGEYTAYFATQFNRTVASLIRRIDHLEQMTKKSIVSIQGVRKAHKELAENIVKRRTMRELLDETQKLAALTKDIIEAYDEMIGKRQ